MRHLQPSMTTMMGHINATWQHGMPSGFADTRRAQHPAEPGVGSQSLRPNTNTFRQGQGIRQAPRNISSEMVRIVENVNGVQQAFCDLGWGYSMNAISSAHSVVSANYISSFIVHKQNIFLEFITH